MVAALDWKGKASRRPGGVADLETVEVFGGDGALGRLIHAEAERALPALRRELAGEVALAYVDPPFETGGAFDYLADVHGGGEGKPSRVAVPAYHDARGLDAWLTWFARLASDVHALLAPGGSFYAHLDAHVVHYAKVVLDEVFGASAFQREIVWRIGWISGFKSRARGWIRNHDTILFYAKGGRPSTFHKEYVPYPEGYRRRDGALPTGKGYPIDDVWNGSEIDRLDSIQIMSFSGEKNGYPTQKNESLVARIVRASSSPGDLVLDPCGGSGTTAAVAAKLGRRWITCDASPVAVHVMRRRLAAGVDARPFVVERDARAEGGTEGELGVSARVKGRICTLELTSYRMAGASRLRVRGWMPRIEGWAVDWGDGEGPHDGTGPLRVGTSLWRDKRGRLASSAAHAFEAPGRYPVRVRAYDVLGGCATRAVSVVVK